MIDLCVCTYIMLPTMHVRTQKHWRKHPPSRPAGLRHPRDSPERGTRVPPVSSRGLPSEYLDRCRPNTPGWPRGNYARKRKPLRTFPVPSTTLDQSLASWSIAKNMKTILRLSYSQVHREQFCRECRITSVTSSQRSRRLRRFPPASASGCSQRRMQSIQSPLEPYAIMQREW